MSTQSLSGIAPQIRALDSARRRRSFIFLIVLVWLIIYAGSLFQPPLLDDADTVHAEAAREMVVTHDWVTLHINNGFRYLEKPPLMYWMTASSFKLFGVHEWSARLPIALGVLALLLVVYSLDRRRLRLAGRSPKCWPGASARVRPVSRRRRTLCPLLAQALPCRLRHGRARALLEPDAAWAHGVDSSDRAGGG